MSSIFICYRRADAGGHAGRIFDALCRSFGDRAVFRDVDKIDVASPFPDVIKAQLKDCRVFIPIIGPAWLGGGDSRTQRLHDPNDWVQIEIATALERGICVIPVTVGGASMPAAKDLPDSLKGLARLQGRDLRDGDTWQGDFDRLEERINRELGRFPRAFKRRAMAVAGVTLLSVLLAAGTQLAQYRFRQPSFNLAAEPVVIFESGNTVDVVQRKEGPPQPTIFTITKPHFLTHLYTYHWNGGEGAAPGRVRLFAADGKEYGPWEVGAFKGHNDRPNVNWVVQPKIALPAGTYTVNDSDPKTWSYNNTSGGRGFVVAKGHPATD